MPPKDKRYAVYILFLAFGLFAYIPMGFFNTATDYWMYKFRQLNNTDLDDNVLTQDLQVAFISDLNIVTTIAGVICLTLTLFYGHYISEVKRIVATLALIFILFVVTIVFVRLDTDDWQGLFFGITLLIAGNMCGASAVLRVTSFMVIAKFPPRFISAILIGQSFGGIFAAVVQIFTLFIASTSTATAFLYFMIAAIVTLFILAYFLAACKIHFFKFHYELEAPKQKGIRSSLKEICKQIWVPTLALLLDTYITHCIHPSVASIIVSTGSGSGNSWNDIYFIPVVAFLLFNIVELVGKVASVKINKPKNKYVLLALASARFVFIPLFLICNTKKHDNIVTLLGDEAYIAIMVFFGLSTGYLTNCLAMIIRSAMVKKEDLEVVLPVVGITLGVSQVLGSLTSLLFIKIV